MYNYMIAAMVFVMRLKMARQQLVYIGIYSLHIPIDRKF